MAMMLSSLWTTKIEKSFSDEEQKTEEKLLTWWSNFAKFGNPSPTSNDGSVWRPVSYPSNDVDYMKISSSPIMKNSIKPERMLLWNKLIWGPILQKIERGIVYRKATEFFQQQLKPVIH